MAQTQQGSHGRQDMDVRTSDRTASGRDTDQWEGHEGEPTSRGGKWLTAALVFVAIAWVVAMVQIFRLPVQEVRVGAESAIWMAIALSCGIGTFILMVWKVHRA